MREQFGSHASDLSPKFPASCLHVAPAPDTALRQSAAALKLSDGLTPNTRGISAWQATGSVTYHTYFVGLLGEALRGRASEDERRTLLTDALALAQFSDEGLYEPELHRLLGDT